MYYSTFQQSFSSFVKSPIITLLKQMKSEPYLCDRYTINRGAVKRSRSRSLWKHKQGLFHCERHTAVLGIWILILIITSSSALNSGTLFLWYLLFHEHQKIWCENLSKLFAINSVRNSGEGCIVTSVAAINPLMWVWDQINLTSTSCI